MDYALKLLLKQQPSQKLIAEFCLAHTKYCSEHGQYVCKRILQINGYKKFIEEQDYCATYKELNKFASDSKLKPIEMDIKMANRLSSSTLISKNLIKFLKINGYDLSTIKMSRSNLNLNDIYIKPTAISTIKIKRTKTIN